MENKFDYFIMHPGDTEWRKVKHRVWQKHKYARKALMPGSNPNQLTDEDKSTLKWNNTSQISNNW